MLFTNGLVVIVRGNILPELLTNLGFAFIISRWNYIQYRCCSYGLGKKKENMFIQYFTFSFS